MSIPVATSKKWSAEYIAVLALTATLVAVIIACIICISLSPAHILFRIQDASLETLRVKREDKNPSLFFNFTLTANNTSRRMKVQYSALSTEVWYTPTGWVVGDVQMPWKGKLQQAGNVSNIRVGVDSGEGHSALPPPSAPAQPGVAAPPPATVDTPIHWPFCKVAVEAKVQFVYGLVRTRPFHIRVACFPVNFHRGTSTYITCNLTE